MHEEGSSSHHHLGSSLPQEHDKISLQVPKFSLRIFPAQINQEDGAEGGGGGGDARRWRLARSVPARISGCVSSADLLSADVMDDVGVWNVARVQRLHPGSKVRRTSLFKPAKCDVSS